MKKSILVSALILVLASCNDSNNTDSTKPNATANDSTSQPNGMTEPSAISVDTAATRVNGEQPK